jgi:hypothetical protein
MRSKVRDKAEGHDLTSVISFLRQLLGQLYATFIGSADLHKQYHTSTAWHSISKDALITSPGMDPSYESSEGEEDAMAKAMGFSAFGTQGPPKKRKFNPAVDAVVDGQALASLDKGGKKGQGSGGNMIPLGKPRTFGVAKPANNEDEINLDGEESEDEETPAYIDTSLPPPAEIHGGGSGDEDEGPAYVDTSYLPDEEAKAAQERIDAILAGKEAIVPSRKIKGKDKGHTQSGIGQFMEALQHPVQHHLPPKPSVTDLPSTGSITSNQWPKERGRQRNELWYLDYYDPSFNANPWAKLEKDRGLESRGVWVKIEGQNV